VVSGARVETAIVEDSTAEDSAGEDPAGEDTAGEDSAGPWLGPAGVEDSVVLAAVGSSALGDTAGVVAWVGGDVTGAELGTRAGAELSIIGDEAKGVEAEGTPH
jgi:hypothetical protein